MSNRELSEAVVAQLESSSAIEPTGEPDPDEDVRWEVSIERARSELGYTPRHTLSDAVAAAAEGSRRAGDRRMG